jgi:tetratricopeptide (TPR) repeat protein
MASLPPPFEKLTSSAKELFPIDQNYVFLAGAGISMEPPTNMPSAIQMVQELFSLVLPDEEISKFQKLKTMRFELAVELFQKVIDIDLNFLDYMEEVKIPNLIHNFLSRFILKGNVVITTNFDYLLEYSMKKLIPETKHGKIHVMITKQDFSEATARPETLQHFYNLIKIHGSKHNIITSENTQDSLVATVSTLGRDRDEGKIFAIEPYKKEILYSLLKNHTLVVMGYSGNDDFDISPVLKEIPYISRLIWIEHTDTEEVEYYRILKNEKSPQEIRKFHQFLFELRNSQNFDIILIKSNTKFFIQNNLWSIFHPEILPKSDDNSAPHESQDFKDFISSIYTSIPTPQKYLFATELYYKIGDFDSAERCAKRGLVTASKSNALAAKSTFFNYLGLINQIEGSYQKALDYYSRALQIDEQLRNAASEASLLNNIGGLCLILSNYDEALKNYELSLRISDELGNKQGKISSLNNIGNLYENMTQLKKALNYYNLALEISEEIGDLERRAVLYNNIGRILSTSDTNAALLHYKKALKLTELLGDLQGQNVLHNNIGRILAEKGDLETAISMFKKSIVIAEKLGDNSKKAGALSNLGSMALAKKDTDQALHYFKQASELENEYGNAHLAGIYYNNIAMIYQQTGKLEKAIEIYKIALQKFESISATSHIALLLSKLGDCYFLRKRYSESLNYYLKSRKLYSSPVLNELKNLAAVTSSLGRNYEVLGNLEESLRSYEDALEIDEELGDIANIAVDYFNIGKLQQTQDHLPVAIDNLRKALDLFTQLGMAEQVESIKQLLNTL